MVDAVDTSSPVGKRDLVACLLAARLGMRASDIVGLRLENLRWRTNTIEFPSRKTGQRTVLPLTNEIGEAIIDYLANGRPESESPNVLLRHVSPHTGMRPARVHRIVTDALNDAGVAFGGRRHGPHALRASLATGMMESKVPLPTISATLSHASEDTTRIYLRVDFKRLRPCALEVPPADQHVVEGGRLRMSRPESSNVEARRVGESADDRPYGAQIAGFLRYKDTAQLGGGATRARTSSSTGAAAP